MSALSRLFWLLVAVLAAAVLGYVAWSIVKDVPLILLAFAAVFGLAFALDKLDGLGRHG